MRKKIRLILLATILCSITTIVNADEVEKGMQVRDFPGIVYDKTVNLYHQAHQKIFGLNQAEKKERDEQSVEEQRKQREQREQTITDYQDSYKTRQFNRLKSLGLNSEEDLIGFDISKLSSQMQENIRLSNMVVREATGERCPEAEKFDAYKEVKYHDEILTRFENLGIDRAPLAYDIPYLETYNTTDKSEIDAKFNDELKFAEFLSNGYNPKDDAIADKINYLFSKRYMPSSYLLLYKNRSPYTSDAFFGPVFGTGVRSGYVDSTEGREIYFPRGIKSDGTEYAPEDIVKIFSPETIAKANKRGDKDEDFNPTPYLDHMEVFGPSWNKTLYNIYDEKIESTLKPIGDKPYNRWGAINYSKFRENLLAKSKRGETMRQEDLDILEEEYANTAISADDSIWDEISYLTGLKERPELDVGYCLGCGGGKKYWHIKESELIGIDENTIPDVWLQGLESFRMDMEYFRFSSQTRRKKITLPHEHLWIYDTKNPEYIKEGWYKGRRIKYYNPVTDEVVYSNPNDSEAVKYDFYTEVEYLSWVQNLFEKFAHDKKIGDRCGENFFRETFGLTFHASSKEEIDKIFKERMSQITEQNWDQWNYLTPSERAKKNREEKIEWGIAMEKAWKEANPNSRGRISH
ncbi:MAG: hypothetical protein KAS87_00480 [Candidatus Omnitrophica bacterium]|nr:hypothetical protein [Candidatus Omnitrophota bacterium]